MNKFSVLKEYFGYDTFRPGQETLIDAVLAGRDVLGIMPTGAGKSLCYQVPALLLPGITLVISPLISLMKDQVQALNQAGIHAAYINSSLTEGQIRKALKLAAEGRYKIIYAAPERLETYEFLQFAKAVEISMLTVDEAHCISQWGQDFRPSYLKILQFLKELDRRPVLSAFTATATEKVKEDVLCVLGLKDPAVLVTGFDRKNLYFAVENTRKKDTYVQTYIREHPKESGIIYCATRKNVDKLWQNLAEMGIDAARYHAGMSNEERRQAQEDFIYDRLPVMVATNAFGMGIDKSNVRYVLHYNMPQSMENYYQEAGRAGRDGEPAECILLYSPQDIAVNRFLMDSKEMNAEFTSSEWEAVRERDEERLRSMTYYCMTADCLRAYILRYFGEPGAGDCQNCSNCMTEMESLDVTEDAKKILACIQETGQRYGVNVIAGTLAASDRAKLREYGVSRFPSFGSLKEKTEPQIKQIISQMEIEGLLDSTKDKYALLKLNACSQEVMKGQRSVVLKKRKAAEHPETAAASMGKTRNSDLLNSRGLELFERLRSLRIKIAKEEGMPPYIIFSDKTLVDLCIRAPKSREEMLKVSGVGEHKFQRYGQAFLEEIREFIQGKEEKLYFGELEEIERERNGDVLDDPRKRPAKKEEFFLTKEQAEKFPYQEFYFAAELAQQMNALREEGKVKKTSGAEIFRRMQAQGYAREERMDGRWLKVVTREGEDFGLRLGLRTSRTGTEYEDLCYGEQAQREIVSWFVREEGQGEILESWT
ncbi:MAG TPA: DNA helicase RecQ [Candidatus Blautia merdavium]|uniref:DNA helicase RecQ n=1 Tax=Candidatus Blautia merdavium TaxID=2838494 RepID=A0A9D2TBB6_9FIRM|nr:DNA helicase RecQ [Candidatus Blautia merdavium]